MSVPSRRHVSQVLSRAVSPMLWCWCLLVLCPWVRSDVVHIPVSKAWALTDGRQPASQMAVSPVDRVTALAYATIHVGTPPQPFTMQIDTGSADFLLPGRECTGCPEPVDHAGQPRVHGGFEVAASKTARYPMVCGRHSDAVCAFRMRYGDGSTTSGVVVEDWMSMLVDNKPVCCFVDATSRGNPRNALEGGEATPPPPTQAPPPPTHTPPGRPACAQPLSP